MLAAFLGKVLVSSDYGQTWIEHNPGEMTDQNWIATSVSPDGRYMMVGGWQWNNHLFISDNYGVTWTEVRPNPSVPATSWQGTAQSDDASVFYAFGWGDNAYRSLNQGADWTKLSIGHNNHYSVNTDQTGNLVLVGSDNDMKIFISRNQGVGWTTVQLDPTGFAQVRTTMSKNGQVMLAYTSGGNGQFYISTDAGYNWNLNSISQPGRMWVSAAVTDDDSLIAAVDSGNNNGRVWLSNNHGQTWTEERPRGDYGDSWRSAVFNSTGSRLYVANYGQIYSGISEVYQPDVGATGVDLNANLSITFNEPVTAVTDKNIYIQTFIDDSIVETIPVTDARVSIGTSQVVIDPDMTFADSTKYYVTIDSGAFHLETSDADYAGISTSSTWNFTTQDTTPPNLVSFSPTSLSDHVALDANLVLIFDEDVVAASGKNILIKNSSDDTTFETIPVTDARVSIGTSQVTINPSATFSSNANYYVLIDSGAFTDLSGNPFVGITSLTTWTFTADDTAPPFISNLGIATSATSAVITWTTNELANSRVYYHIVASGTYTPTPLVSSQVINHSYTLNSLLPCTTYYYYVYSADAADNESSSPPGYFTTTCTASATILDQSATNESGIPSGTGGIFELLSSNSGVAISAPSSYTNFDAIFQVKKLDSQPIIATILAPVNQTLIGSAIYDLKAYQDPTTPITAFDQPLLITMTYTDTEVSDYIESTLKIHRYDDFSWTELSNCSVDTIANTVSCYTNHFSLFGIFGQSPTPTPTPVPTLIPSNLSPPSSRSSPNYTSLPPAPPACTDTKPTSLPDLFQINISGTTAKLYFTPLSDTNQYYISFSAKPNAEEHGAVVTLTREGVQNFTVNLLKPKTTYYFKVRGQNGCMPGDWSNIMKVTTPAGSIAKFTPAYKNIFQQIKSALVPKKVEPTTASLSPKLPDTPINTVPTPTFTVKPTISSLPVYQDHNSPSKLTPTPSPKPKRCFLWWCWSF